MTDAIIKWLGGNDTGLSSKAIALTALGQMPERAATSYPHDGADFGRCYRLLQAAPDAQHGLRVLGRDGGPYWRALVAKWAEIEAAYLAEIGGGLANTYEVMQAILRPIEDQDRSVVRLAGGVTMRWGGQ